MRRRLFLSGLLAAGLFPAIYAERAKAAGLRGSGEFLYQALRGNVAGITRVVLSGRNADIDTATTPEDIWGGTGLIPRPAADESIEVLSSSANDTAAGTGARTLSVESVNAAGAIVSQVVALNGVTPVVLPTGFRAINASSVATAGSLGGNAGLITFRVAGGGADRGYISAPISGSVGTGVLNQARYTVPTGFRVELLSLLIGMQSSLGNELSETFMVVRNSAGRELSVVAFPLFAAGSPLYRHEIDGGVNPFNVLAAGSEVTLRTALVSQNNTAVEVSALALRYDTSVFP